MTDISEDLEEEGTILDSTNLGKLLDTLGFKELKRLMAFAIEYEHLPSADFLNKEGIPGVDPNMVDIKMTPGGGLVAINDKEGSVGFMHSGVGFAANSTTQNLYLTNGKIYLEINPEGISTNAVIKARGFIEDPSDL